MTFKGKKIREIRVGLCLHVWHLNLWNYQIRVFYLIIKEHTVIYRHISDAIFRINLLLITQHHSLMNMIFRGIQKLI